DRSVIHRSTCALVTGTCDDDCWATAATATANTSTNNSTFRIPTSRAARDPGREPRANRPRDRILQFARFVVAHLSLFDRPSIRREADVVGDSFDGVARVPARAGAYFQPACAHGAVVGDGNVVPHPRPIAGLEPQTAIALVVDHSRVAEGAAYVGL